jgi:hypothetical protein
MATQRVPALPFASQTSPQKVEHDPHQQALPRSFQEALRLGWFLVEEETTTDDREQQRQGVALLRHRGISVRLRVPYTATPKQWVFGKPEPIE